MLRRTLVVAQVAFTFVLLLGAGLLLASFAQVLQVDPGFVAERVTTASVSLPRSRYADDDARRRFTDEALRRVRALPGVVAAGATSTIPFGGAHSDSVILAEGYLMKPGESVISPAQVDVTPGYFEAMGAKLVEGRFFEDKDTAGALPGRDRRPQARAPLLAGPGARSAGACTCRRTSTTSRRSTTRRSS